MNILFNNDRLLRLITNLHTLTGIWANIFDVNGKDIQIIGSHNPFCQLINATPEGHARCEACDAAAVRKCAATRGIYLYRCHAGVCEVVLPISESVVRRHSSWFPLPQARMALRGQANRRKS